jgi:hypothetical protein
MRLSSARGLILEEIVLHLLELVGYRIVRAGEEGTRSGRSGLEVQGRGEWHQIDGLAAFDRTPAFMYPLRLLVEAKCYSPNRPVGIEVTRNAVGVLRDISENYFTYTSSASPGVDVQVPRFNYHSAIFSSSGYTSGAQRFAIAHQVFLIQYEKVALLKPIIEGLLALIDDHLEGPAGAEADVSSRLREDVRELIRDADKAVQRAGSALSIDGFHHVRLRIIRPLLKIKGSYFGMLQGRWPMHLLSLQPLPKIAFQDKNEIRCRLYGRDSSRWSFVPVGAQKTAPDWFRLDFDIPSEILEFVREARGDPIALSTIKKDSFSYLDLAGRIGGIQRQVRLLLDEEWLDSYRTRIGR